MYGGPRLESLIEYFNNTHLFHFFSCVKARARGVIEICYCMSWTCFELSFGIVILFGHICSYVLFESMYES